MDDGLIVGRPGRADPGPCGHGKNACHQQNAAYGKRSGLEPGETLIVFSSPGLGKRTAYFGVSVVDLSHDCLRISVQSAGA